ncbi:MAG: DNA primase [Gemmatimonadota bacterium]|nr:DNA primase [Gemmatimonadota bacterium]
MIPDDVVERVREAADIVAIIGEHVSLKRMGASFRGPCPFHQGTHRNFSVTPGKGIYHCFVCKESGDVFTFLQKRLGMDWPSAVKLVGEKAGIEVREVDTRREGPDPREPFWEVNAAAGEFFRRMLLDEEGGRPARDYLALRRVTREAGDHFQIGFAPRDPAALRKSLLALGYDDDRLLETGLLVRREDSDELRPRFRNRLIFPIFDGAGHPVGFGGRLLGPGEPKYLNSAESPVFNKGRLLYGLNWAKHAIRRDERVLIVEGYFDALRLVSAGIDAVVAPLGTALTEQQAQLLQRFAKTACLLYDSDQAGLRATFRAGDELLRHGIAVQVVTLPDGEDPDSFVDQHGAAELHAQLAQAIDVFDRKVQLLERGGWFADLQKKRRALDRLLPTLRATADPLTRDIYIARAVEAAGVSRETLLREIEQGPRRQRGVIAVEPTPARESATASARESAAHQTELRTAERRQRERRRAQIAGGAAERELVRVMLFDRGRIERISERIGVVEFHDPVYREIFEALRRDSGADAEILTGSLSEDAAAVVQDLMAEPDALTNARKTEDGSVSQLRVRAIKGEMSEIDRTISIADSGEKDRLTRRKMELMQEIRALDGAGFSHYGKSRR